MAVREQRVPVTTDGDIDIKSFQQADVVLDPMRLIADLRAQVFTTWKTLSSLRLNRTVR